MRLTPSVPRTVALCLLAACAPARSSHAPLVSADVAAITAVGKAYEAAWLAGDSAGVMRLFTPDAVLLPHHGVPRVVGHEAMRRFWWPPNSPATTITDLALTPDEVGGEGRIAYASGRFRLAFSWEQDGRVRNVRNAGTYIMLFRKQPDGSWRITHHMWDDPPPERT